MKKVDMAYSKAEQKKRSSPEKMPEIVGANYPYGLEISLDKGSLEKLGIDSLPKVGKKIRIEAVCEVVGVSQNQHRDSQDRNVRLQIVKMGCETAPQSMEDAIDDGVDEA